MAYSMDLHASAWNHNKEAIVSEVLIALCELTFHERFPKVDPI